MEEGGEIEYKRGRGERDGDTWRGERRDVENEAGRDKER